MIQPVLRAPLVAAAGRPDALHAAGPAAQHATIGVAPIAGAADEERPLAPAANTDTQAAHNRSGVESLWLTAEVARFGRNKAYDALVTPGRASEATDFRAASELRALLQPLRSRNPEVIRLIAATSRFHLGSLDGNVTLAPHWRGRAGHGAADAIVKTSMSSVREVAMRARVSRRPVRRTRQTGGHRLQLTAVVERDRRGYVATCPQLQGCYTQGHTYEEVVRNIRDAIRLHLEDRLAVGEPLPVAGEVTLAVLDVAV